MCVTLEFAELCSVFSVVLALLTVQIFDLLAIWELALQLTISYTPGKFEMR